MMMELKVPRFEPRELDRLAAGLLREYAAHKKVPVRPPIDVDGIVEGLFGLALELGDLRKILGIPDVLGATWFDDRRVCIEQSLEDKEGRFAFTVAHEAAHWYVHRPIFEANKVALPLFPYKKDAPPKPAVICRDTGKKPPAEWQADQLAARILMPPSEVRAAAESVHGDEPLVIEGLDAARSERRLHPDLRMDATEVIVAGDFSNVSNEAMCYRLLDLGLVVDERRHQPKLF